MPSHVNWRGISLPSLNELLVKESVEYTRINFLPVNKMSAAIMTMPVAICFG